MGVVALIRERADCIEAAARYPHERVYAAGLRRAADILDTRPVDAARALMTAIRTEADHETRRGMRKALAILEEARDVRDHDLLESLVERLDAVESALVGLTLMMRPPHIDLSEQHSEGSDG